MVLEADCASWRRRSARCTSCRRITRCWRALTGRRLFIPIISRRTVGILHRINIDRAVTLTLIQNLAHRVNNSLIIDIRRRSDSWLFSSTRQLVCIYKLSSLRYSCRKIIICGMKSQIFLSFCISYPIHEFPSQKRVGLRRLDVCFRPRLPM